VVRGVVCGVVCGVGRATPGSIRSCSVKRCKQ